MNIQMSKLKTKKWFNWLMLSSILTVVAVICFSVFEPNPTSAQTSTAPIYAQLSGSASQQPTVTTPVNARLNVIDEISSGITVRNNTDVVIQRAGKYVIIAAAQVGKTRDTENEYVDLFLRRNGASVANSNTRQSIIEPNFTAVLVSQGAITLSAGDVINATFSVSSTDDGVGIIATQPPGEPLIPSIIFTIFQL